MGSEQARLAYPKIWPLEVAQRTDALFQSCVKVWSVSGAKAGEGRLFGLTDTPYCVGIGEDNTSWAALESRVGPSCVIVTGPLHFQKSIPSLKRVIGGHQGFQEGGSKGHQAGSGAS